VPLGCRESEDVINGSSAVFGRVAIDQTLGNPLTVGVAEGGPLDSVGHKDVAIRDGVRVEDIVISVI
jgi:hypothetical protein